MPWEVRPNKGKFCVYKKGGTTPISGGCYAKRADAVAKVKALYANYTPKKMSEVQDNIVVDIKRAFAEVGEEKVVWIEAMPAKTWHTLKYGEVPITVDKLQRFAENFNNGVRGQDIATDYDHGLDPSKGTKASGWYRGFEVRPNTDGTQSLWAGIEFTETAKKEIKDKEWRYFSLDWEDYWQHPETQEVHEDVVCGGGLTNRPIAKGMVPINFSEVFIERDEGVEGKTLSEVLDEVADLEHSEPGTGIPPQPREQEHEEIDVETGSRREPLPVPLETEDSVMTDEQLKKLKKLFGIEGDDVEADVVIAKAQEIVGEHKTFSERVPTLETEVAELKTKLPPDVQAAKKFAEEYPDEHKRMTELERVNRDNSAKTFSETIKRFTEKDGEETKPTKFGLSGLALQTISEAHKKFSEGSGTLADFEGAVESVINNGVVDYSEEGSSVEPSVLRVDETGTAGGVQANRKAFSEAVNKKRVEFAEKNEGKEMPLDEAIRTVTKENPDLAAAYRQSASA